MHESSYIPYTEPLVPAAASSPALTAKHAPINASDELGMSAHAAELSWSFALIVAVTPDAAGHIVAGAEKKVRQMRTPSNLAHCVFVALKELERTSRLPDVEGADNTVDACRCDDCAAVLIPVMR